MRLAILTQYYPPEMGAPQARLSELAAAFVARGHDVEVLTAMPNYPLGRVHDGYGGVLRRESRDGVRVVRTFVYATQRLDLAHRLTSYASFVVSSAIVGTLALRRPDYLLVESPPLFLGVSALWLSRRHGARLVFNVSDLWPGSAADLGVVRRDGAAYRASARLEALLYRQAWLVTGQSEGIVDDVRARFPECATYHLSNGVDTDAFHPARASDAARRTLAGDHDDGRCIAVYAGLHGLAQGLGAVVDAAATFGPDDGLTVALVGDGPEKAALQADAAARGLRHVRFLSPRPRAEIAAMLGAADIVLVPLKRHLPGAVPSKLYEAMACGRPVVIVADGEPADIVRRTGAGLVVAPGDGAGLAAALRTLRDDPALRATLGANGRRAAEQRYERRSICARFVDYLEAGLAQRGRRAARPTLRSVPDA